MAIKERGEEPRLRHASMRPFVIESKLDLKCLSKAELKSDFDASYEVWKQSALKLEAPYSSIS